MAKIYILLVALMVLTGCGMHHLQKNASEEQEITEEDSIISAANVYETVYTGFGLEEPISGTDTIKYYIKLELITKVVFDQKRKTARLSYTGYSNQKERQCAYPALP
jgi:hypothetical protein